MGNSGSLLKVPLVPQSQPVRSTRSSLTSRSAVSLTVELTGMNTTFRIFDANTGALLHDLQPSAGSTMRTICSASGVPVATMLPTKGGYDVYDGTDTNVEPVAVIRATAKPGFAPFVYAEFEQRSVPGKSGESCRVVVEGFGEDRVVLVGLERGGNFTPIPREKKNREPYGTIVGRFRRPKTDGVVFEGREKMYIEVEAGVDLTLLAMLWCVRYEMYYKSVVGGGAFTKFIKSDLYGEYNTQS